MSVNQSSFTGPAAVGQDPHTVDSLAAHLSHKDRQVRQNAVVALGNTGDRRAIEPLIFVLSRELARGASSYPVIIDILDALAKIPDRVTLDVLIRLEGQLVDRGSPHCPAGLAAGIITYADAADGSLHRVVPKELHFKFFDVLRRLSVQLDYKIEEVATRYKAYQDEIIAAEIDRTIPLLARAIREGQSEIAPEGIDAPAPADDIAIGEPLLAENAMDGIDYAILRREMEIEVTEYLRDNNKLQALIREGQRIKAHIQLVKAEKSKFGAGMQAGPAMSVRP